MHRLPRLLLVVALALLAALSPSPAETRPAAEPIASSFIYPVGSPLAPPTWDPRNANGYYITQGFNDSCDPNLGQGYYAYGLYYCGHTGVDLASNTASNIVHAAAAGVVAEAADDGGYGVTVRLRHLLADGQVVYTQYEHMQYGSLQVYAGETVGQGQELGLVGATGFASGAHLHFEVKTIDAGGPGYTFGNSAELASFFDPLAFVAAHAVHPMVLVTPAGHAIPEWPAEADAVLQRFLRSYAHFVSVSTAHGVYVRAGPGVRYPAKGIALRGARLGYLKRLGNWLYVALPEGVKGWVGKDVVQGFGYWDVPWPPRGPVALVDTLGLHMHDAPGQRHTVIGLCFQGDLVAVHATTSHWTLVSTRQGTRGWVLTRYLLAPGVARPRGGGLMITAEAAVLRVRSGPGLRYPVVGAVFRGTALQVVRISPHWVAVILPGGTTGWVARAYTSLAPMRGGAHLPARASYVRVNVYVINIHEAPGGRRVIAHAFRRTRLLVLGRTTHWLHVALPATRIEGWVLRRLVISR